MTNGRKSLKANRAANELLIETLKKYADKLSITEKDKLIIEEEVVKALHDGADADAMLDRADLDNPGWTHYHYFKLPLLEIIKDLLLDSSKSNLSPSTFLKLVLRASITKHDSDTQELVIDPEQANLQGKLIRYALDHGASISINNFPISLEVLSEHKGLLLESTNLLEANKFLILVLEQQKYNFLTAEKRTLIESLAKYAIDKGADLNIKNSFDGEEFIALTLFEKLFVSNMFDVIDYARKVNSQISYTIGVFAWAYAMSKNFNIAFISNIVQKFPNEFSEEETIKLGRSHGASYSGIHLFLDIYHLAIDFNKARLDENASILSKTELQILNSEQTISLSDCESGKYQNNYGFSPLSLALISDKLELAIEMIENGHSLTEKNINGVTPIAIINELIKEPGLIQAAFKRLGTLDIWVSEDGESLTDNFLDNGGIANEALEKTIDPLFTFYKPGATLFEPSLHPEKIHIAISMEEGFWSTGFNAFSRLISREYTDITFHLVTFKMMEEGGDAFIKQFNGWINPGAADNYPEKKFNKNDWKRDKPLDMAYTRALDKTYEFKIPYLGVCAGAQHLVLFHDGYVQPVKGYSSSEHSITYLKGTLPHFFAMSHEQQNKALQFCKFPEIKFKGDTAHHYVAVSDTLGKGLQLGAISEDGFAMSYAHKSGLRHATQFHPEHYYHVEDGKINHQRMWLKNFIHLTKLHHNHVKHGFPHPEVLFKHVSARLEECLKMPTCLSEQNIFGNSSISDLLFDY